MAPAVLIITSGDSTGAPAGPLASGLRALDAAVTVEFAVPPGPSVGAQGAGLPGARSALGRLRERGIPALATSTGARVVVSDEPATIAALGRLRSAGRLAAPAVALVTRPSDPASQAAAGVDLHLLTEPSMRAPVRQAAPDSRVACVRGLLDDRYEANLEIDAARRSIGVPDGSPLIVIWGGQDARGDLAGAGQVSLGADPAARVVVLCGRNEAKLSGIQGEFALAKRLRAVGPTDRLPDLLAAADVVIDTCDGIVGTETRLLGASLVGYPGRGTAARQELANEVIAALREPRVATGGYADRPLAAAEVLAVAGLMPAPAAD